MARRTFYQLATDALDRLARGESISAADRRRVEKLAADTGARRPLETYSPRQRRRYLRVGREQQATRSEQSAGRQRRRQGERSQLDEIERLRATIEATSLDSDQHDADAIAERIDVYGISFVLAALRQQLSSIHDWNEKGRPYYDKNVPYSQRSPIGSQRWADRDAFVRAHSKFRDQINTDEHTDPYFYYHGVIS